MRQSWFHRHPQCAAKSRKIREETESRRETTKPCSRVTVISPSPSGIRHQWLTSLPVISCSGGIDLEDL
ncbi:hypothetical protein BDA96_03G210300 [Sorghum bicolor]|uniref:Uncharacterized protein n=2 Tax=Sorghum bicolor TaxID=4558 RepID=A0A921RF55_SORBI|nr:hypothetical protein BDA96_03G210300 [Sorghum bicolor]OQU75599.1 hypothetical protein SORBI_3K016700 [Sorghum bicolor]